MFSGNVVKNQTIEGFTIVRQLSIFKLEAIMEFMTVRELSKSPKDTLTRLSKDGKAVLTNNGKPQAIIFKIDGESFERTLTLLQRLEFMQNLSEMRFTSMQNGNTTMSLDEINAEIAAARKERKIKKR